jgi:hypothetical protein
VSGQQAVADAVEALALAVRDYGKRGGVADKLLPAERQEPAIARAMQALEILGVAL